MRGGVIDVLDTLRAVMCLMRVTCLIVAMCVGAAVPLASAQAPATAPEQAIAPDPAAALSITRVDFGFGGSLVPERWQPVVVWLFSERAFDGVVSLEYQQDGSQRARVEAAFATTPGKAIPVELVCAPPHRLSRLVVRVRGGPRELRRVYSQFPGEFEQQLPMPTDGGLIVLSLGKTGADEAMGSWWMTTVGELEVTGDGEDVPPQPPDKDATQGWREPSAQDALTQWRQRVRTPVLNPASAPLGWLAYDAASVVIARAVTLESMDVRRRAALMTWVESGGRLIVLMDPGTAWTGAAAFPDAPLPVEAGEIRTLAPVLGADGGADSAFEALDEPQRPRELAGRSMVLTPQGSRDGWRLGWRVVTGADERGPRGLLATGPVGMGIVTLLGIEPRLVPAIIDRGAEAKLWQQVLVGDEVGLLPQYKRPDTDVEPDQWWYQGSGQDIAGAEGISSALDITARGLAVPAGVFVLVGLSMVTLALLVGPVDFFLLRRRGLGGRTWVAAIGWIGLATAGAYFLPTLLQTRGSELRRIEMVDVIASSALGDANATPNAAASRAYEMGLSGIFTVGSGVWQEREDGTGGRWWRGVSSTPMGYGGESATSLLDDLRVRLAGSEGDVSLRRTMMAGLSNPQWTFRGLMDVTPGHDRAWKVRVISRNDEETVVRVEGLEPGMRVVAAALTVPWHPSTPSTFMRREDGGAVELEFLSSTPDSRGVPAPAAAGLRVLTQTEEEALRAVPTALPSMETAPVDVSLEKLAALPGVRERDAAIERRVHAADESVTERLGYACLYLSIIESGDGAGSMPLAVQGRMEHSRRVLARVVFDWPIDSTVPRALREAVGEPAREKP